MKLLAVLLRGIAEFFEAANPASPRLRRVLLASSPQQAAGYSAKEKKKTRNNWLQNPPKPIPYSLSPMNPVRSRGRLIIKLSMPSVFIRSNKSGCGVPFVSASCF